MKNTPSDEKLLLHQSRQRFAGILRINKKTLTKSDRQGSIQMENSSINTGSYPPYYIRKIPISPKIIPKKIEDSLKNVIK